ncbi:iron-siderophore ABC transporter substrate-binding protein [Celeribacter sp. ULVN23_4]
MAGSFVGGALASPVPRIAAIDWAMAETARALGLTPVAIAELTRLKEASAMTFDPSIRDLGLRGAPNLEALSLTRPDLILSSNYYSFVEPQLSRVAPVFSRPLFVAGEPVLPKALSVISELAQTLGFDTGDRVRAGYEERLKDHAQTLAPITRPTLLFSFGDARHVQVYGADSLYGSTLAALGLTNAWGEGTQFGFNAPVPLTRLAEFAEAQFVIVGPVPVAARQALENSVLWRALSPVRAGRLVHLPDNNPFGGAPSALYFADNLTEALTT